MVGSRRWQRIAELLRAASEGDDVTAAVAAVAADTLGMDGVTLTLVSAGEALATYGSVASAVALTQRQFVLGEGPIVAALAGGSAVLSDDVRTRRAALEAPVFSAEADGAGVRAVVAFPLVIGGAVVGVMAGYRSQPGSLDSDQFADGLIVASLVAFALLEYQGGLQGDSGTVGRPWSFEPSEVLDDAVQIASGMVAEQLDVAVAEGLARMRAYAFASDATVGDVARRIVARDLRIER